jgi:hypothetical protein
LVFESLREEHALRMFENRVLRRIFGSKREEMMGEWRKLHNKELCDLYSSPSIITIIMSRRIRWVGHVACMGEKRNAYRLLVGEPEGRRPLGRPRHCFLASILVLLSPHFTCLRVASFSLHNQELFRFHKILKLCAETKMHMT